MIRRYSRGLFQQDRSKADIAPSLDYVRFAPESGQTGEGSTCPLCAQKRTFALQQKAPLFDHLIGSGEQLRGQSETEHECRLRVDDEFELARLHHRQILGLRAPENAGYVGAGLTISIRDVGSVAD